MYDGAGTNRNTRYSFSFQHNNPQGKAGTLGEIDTVIAQRLAERDRDFELSRLREKLGETEGQLEEAEEYASQLQTRIVELEQEQKGKMLKLGDLGASVLMGLLRNNARNIPGGEALAGILGVESDSTVSGSQPHVPEGKASYSKGEIIDEQTRNRLALLQQMQQQLSEQEMIGIINIIGYLTEHPEQITTVIELLQTENTRL
jgi:hypothetical protein